MKRSNFFIPTLRENPNDAVIKSHQLLFRAGLLRKLGNGLFTYLPLGLRVFNKLSAIIREELSKIGALEFKPSVVVPAELWQKSNRWYTMGPELLRMKNRLGQDLVLSPTAEELFTELLKNELSSYKNYPLTAYQINTKYRDEIRPRYGLMRTREFTMMDAYSFHTTDKSLDEIYNNFESAYTEIFRRCGLSTIIVKADSGTMGGSGSEEFMVESEVGDDTLILCPDCRYSANLEKAESKDAHECPDTAVNEKILELETPDVKTIEDLQNFLHLEKSSFIKTVMYEVKGTELQALNEQFTKNKSRLIAVCIRGDLEVNEAKLKSQLKISELELAGDESIEQQTNAVVGFIGPIALQGAVLVADHSVEKMHGAVCGANKKDTHLKNVEPSRDFHADYSLDIRSARAGDLCIHCGAPLYTKKGTEVGHIFKLGKKYTEAMEFTYLDENGKQSVPTMGCYGIGVDRTLAAIIEEHSDDKGIIWPMSVAPFHVTLLTITKKEALNETAEKFCADLEAEGIEVLFDDRTERAGVKLADSELLGIPLRAVLSDKNNGKVEIHVRATGETKILPLDESFRFIKNFVTAELAKYCKGLQ